MIEPLDRTIPSIETSRLSLIPIRRAVIEALLKGRSADAAALSGITFPDGWPGHQDVSFLRLRHEQLENAAWGEWLLRAMILRGPGSPMIGHIGFHGPPAAVGRAELGYKVFPEYRRNGYALEAARALMDWAAREHGTATFFVSIAPDNAPSLAMAAKMGFTKVGEQMDEVDGLEYVFELRRS